jgi:hypothetical protein
MAYPNTFVTLMIVIGQSERFACHENSFERVKLFKKNFIGRRVFEMGT